MNETMDDMIDSIKFSSTNIDSQNVEFLPNGTP